jgi:ribosomal protein S18 acetylase RimI-like enzyme
MPFPNPRPYRSDEQDLPRMLALLRSRWLEAAPEPDDFHPGDILWQRFMHEDQLSRWFERVLLWEEGERLLGFTIFYPKNTEVVFCLAREVDSDTELLKQMLQANRDLALRFNSDPSELTTGAFPGSGLERSMLSLGSQPVDQPFFRMNGRTLSPDDALDAQLPAGWIVRPVTGPEDYEGRVKAHRASFAQSKVSVAAYTRMRAIPGYDAEMDLVAVGPDGTIASFAIAWFDAETKTALFEPVGALPEFRRRGLTRAVLIESLRRLRERGATRVYVNSLEDSVAAIGLYESAGFRQVQRLQLYALPTE